MEQGQRRYESTLSASLKEENVAGRLSHENCQILLNKKMRELSVANCFEYSLLCFVLNINLTYYNIIKSSVDGDRSQVFWITQNLRPLRKKYETEFQYHPFRFHQNAKYFKTTSFQKCNSQHPCRKSNATAKNCHLMRNISQMH